VVDLPQWSPQIASCGNCEVVTNDYVEVDFIVAPRKRKPSGSPLQINIMQIDLLEIIN
jgi:hypothetical protein